MRAFKFGRLLKAVEQFALVSSFIFAGRRSDVTIESYL